MIVSDYWDEIDSVITDVVGEIVFDYHELISPYIMSVDRFMNAKRLERMILRILLMDFICLWFHIF